MFPSYSLKTKSYRCFNHRTKTILERSNVREDEKFRIQEIILDYNFDQETNTRNNRENIEVFYEIDTDL